MPALIMAGILTDIVWTSRRLRLTATYHHREIAGLHPACYFTMRTMHEGLKPEGWGQLAGSIHESPAAQQRARLLKLRFIFPHPVFPLLPSSMFRSKIILLSRNTSDIDFHICHSLRLLQHLQSQAARFST